MNGGRGGKSTSFIGINMGAGGGGVMAVGLAPECSEKIPRNRLGTVFVIPQKKVLIPSHSEVHGRVNSETRNGMEFR